MKKKLFRNGFLTRVISLAVALVLLLSYCPTVFPAHAAEEGTTKQAVEKSIKLALAAIKKFMSQG